jgi:tRNA(adenine34) deaminase
MQLALSLARQAADQDEVPVGAVITHKDRIVAKAFNQVETLKDPTAHAELLAVTQAVNTLKEKWLYGCTLYVTLEPCSMCAGALVLARLARVVVGADDPKAGACGTVLDITQHPQLNHRVAVTRGVLAPECGTLLTDFFREKRAASPRTESRTDHRTDHQTGHPFTAEGDNPRPRP